MADAQKKIVDKIKIVFRCYTQKPRTNGGVWEGPAMSPDPYKAPDFEAGIEYTRRLMRRIIDVSGLALADEAVFTGNANYVGDLLSYVAIGARSTEDPEHRKHASAIDVPVGIKNPTDGSLEMGINGVYTAQVPAHMYLHGQQVLTAGCQFAHLILRGGRAGSGKIATNFGLDDVLFAQSILQKKGIRHPAIIIDASHDNSRDPLNGKKNYLRQIEVIREVLAYRATNSVANALVKGFMTENFLLDGNQPLDALVKAGQPIDPNGLSCTDACLGREKTLQLIDIMYQLM